MNRTGTPTSASNRPTFCRMARRARFLMLAVAPVAAVLATPALGATLTWDPSQTTIGSDGSGNWDLSSSLWSTGSADTVWSNDGSATAVFGVGGTAGTVTLVAPIQSAGLTFNATPGTDYTLAASGANTLTLTAPTITVAAGQAPTLSAPIAGASGLALSANGANLTLTGANTYTGTTAINSGTLTVGAGGSLGDPSNALTIGSGGFATSLQGNLVINNNVTVGSLTTTTETTSAAAVVVNTLSIGTGFTLTDTGAFTQGIGAVDSNVSNTSMTVSGGGTLNISPTNNANFQLGGINANNNNGNSNATLTMTNLGDFVYDTGATGTGNFNVGFGFKSLSRLLLAANSTITASTLNVGNSNGGNNGSTSNLTLGTGVNILNVANIIIGIGKESGTINFPAAATASTTLLIDGQAGGATTANITVGTASSGSGTGTSTLLLAGHTATVQANTVIIGNLAGASNGVGTGNVTFDTGTFTASSVQLGVASSGSSGSAAGPSGTLTVGGAAPNTTATGVLNVTGSFFLANNTLGTSTANTTTITSKGNFTINGGTVNIGANIQVAGQATTSLTLAGGTLNMEGFQINGAPAAGQSNIVNLPSGTQTATLENLGGTGINGQGLTTSSGNLILEGNNTYTGPTNVNGDVTVGTGGTTGTLGVGGIILNGNLTFNRSATYTTTDSINGTGAINQIGTGTIVLAGANAGGGPINISNGTLVTTGNFGDVTMSSGALHPGTTAGDGSVGNLTLSSLTTTGGDLRFDIGAASDLITVNGPASFTGTTLSVVADGALTPGTLTLLTASAGITGLPTLTTTAIGRTSFTLAPDGNNLELTISGSAAALFWNGINGSTWNANDLGGGVANFKNGAVQDVFFSGDSVTFDDSNNGTDSVSISGTVAPAALTFANNLQNYTLSGGGITGSTGLTLSGTGNVTLANVNTFTGDTSITGGTLTIASGGSIASANISVGSGAALTVASGGDITVAPALADSGIVTFSNASRTLASLSGSGTVNLNGTALTLAGGGTFAGGIQGTGALVVSGGTVVLSGASGYTGGTSITGGTLQLGAGGLTGSVTGAIAVGASGVLTVDLSGGNVTNGITGAGGVALIGGNTQIFTGVLNYSGLSTINGGAFEIAGANTDSIGATAGTGNLIVGDGSTATALTVTGSGSTAGSVTVNAASTLNVAASGSLLGNSGVTLNGGTLIAGNNNATGNLGSGPLTVSSAGGTLQFTATSTNNGFANPIALNGNLTVNFNDSGTVGRNFTYAGNGTVSGGGITGAGNLAILNSGTLGLDTFILSSANPNLSGNILVGNASGAAVRLEVTDALADTSVRHGQRHDRQRLGTLVQSNRAEHVQQHVQHRGHGDRARHADAGSPAAAGRHDHRRDDQPHRGCRHQHRHGGEQRREPERRDHGGARTDAEERDLHAEQHGHGKQLWFGRRRFRRHDPRPVGHGDRGYPGLAQHGRPATGGRRPRPERRQSLREQPLEHRPGPDGFGYRDHGSNQLCDWLDADERQCRRQRQRGGPSGQHHYPQHGHERSAAF
jgi:fibronectin-binding autotransporter adhesin